LIALLSLLSACFLTQPTMTPARVGPTANAEPTRLEAQVRKLVTEFSPRDVDHPENLEHAAAWLHAEFVALGLRVEDETWEADGQPFRNVVATVGPTSKERIVIGAHYDGFGPNPAADDNASGVAGLLELARLLARNPPPFQVELVAFSLEEPPYFREPQM